MANVPYQPVVWRVEDIVQRHGQFHRTEVGAQVPTSFGHCVDQVAAQFVGQRAQLRTRQTAQIGRALNRVKHGMEGRYWKAGITLPGKIKCHDGLNASGPPA